MRSPSLSPSVEKWMKDASRAIFLLDFDGTMVYLADDPNKVIVPQLLINNLKKISQNENLSFAIVTGRALPTLDMLLKGVTTMAVGNHGAEWRPHANAAIEIIAPSLPLSIRKALSAVAHKHQCIYEDKTYTVSMHLPHEYAYKDITAEIRDAIGSDTTDYDIRRIDRTYEVLQRNINKGTGIRRILEQPAFAKKWPIYIGDDVDTDKSLEVVDKLGGKRLGVSNHAAHEKPKNKKYMSIDSVNWIVQLLADYAG